MSYIAGDVFPHVCRPRCSNTTISKVRPTLPNENFSMRQTDEDAWQDTADSRIRTLQNIRFRALTKRYTNARTMTASRERAWEREKVHRQFLNDPRFTISDKRRANPLESPALPYYPGAPPLTMPTPPRLAHRDAGPFSPNVISRHDAKMIMMQHSLNDEDDVGDDSMAQGHRLNVSPNPCALAGIEDSSGRFDIRQDPAGVPASFDGSFLSEFHWINENDPTITSAPDEVDEDQTLNNILSAQSLMWEYQDSEVNCTGRSCIAIPQSDTSNYAYDVTSSVQSPIFEAFPPAKTASYKPPNAVIP
jgi:hypothetical protein